MIFFLINFLGPIVCIGNKSGVGGYFFIFMYHSVHSGVCMHTIDDLKASMAGTLRYRLKNGNVYVSKEGFHFLDHLDPVEDISSEVDASMLTDEKRTYIEQMLQSNTSRFDKQVSAVFNSIHVRKEPYHVLDIGCGGGLFLSKMEERGFNVMGLELNDSRIHYARTIYGLTVHKKPIEDIFWSQKYPDFFDIVTLWDVIEHVNFPYKTLQHTALSTKKNGLLFIDTPCRDSFYHQFGEWSYALSNGTFPTFLNTMYSSEKFGHKQIFSTDEMRDLLLATGFEILHLEKFHELSFPYDFYLKKMLRSDVAVQAALPFVKVALQLFPIRNKMLVVARKKA